jgi:hypothetical protein
MGFGKPFELYSEPTVAFTEIDEPKTTSTYQKGEGFRKLKCAWADRVALMRQLLGYQEVVGGSLHIYLPNRFPWAGLQNYVAYKVDISPYDSNLREDTLAITSPTTRAAKYDFAQLDVSYASAGAGTTWRRESIRGAAELKTLSVPYQDELGEEETKETSVIMPGSEWSYNVIQPGEPPSFLMDLEGYINQYPLYSQTYSRWFAADTLYFATPQFVIDRDYAGAAISDITFTFLYRAMGWNYFPKIHRASSTGVLPRVYSTQWELIPTYPEYDFRGWVI